MKVTIVSPEKTLYEGEVGTVECIGNEPYQITVSGGFVEVANNAISVCVEM